MSAVHAWILPVDDHPNGCISSTRLESLESVRARMRGVRRKLSGGDRLHAVTNAPKPGFSEARPLAGLPTALGR